MVNASKPRSAGAIRQARYRAKKKASEVEPKATASFRVSDALLHYARRSDRTQASEIFKVAEPMPGVVPKGTKLAMDSAFAEIGAWAGNYGYAYSEGVQFLGYPHLAQLAQRPEYRRIVEVIATEMTRKWIQIKAAGDDGPNTQADKGDKIAKLTAEFERLKVQARFKELAEHDGFFGRAHLYIDTGDTDDPNELQTSIGTGSDDTSKAKIRVGSIKSLRTIEPIWTYPNNYNASDPLRGDWYKPDLWYVMGKQVHTTRLLTFVAREVPDILKPAYAFGGLSLTQMAQPYVENWLQTRQSVNDLIQSFSTFVMSTDMIQRMSAGGDEALIRRVELFNQLRNNRGLMVLDKELETFENVSAPLGGLHELQAQAQEHMSAVSGIPLVKLLGVTPSGLNASSDGEIRSFYDWIGAQQQSVFKDHLERLLNLVQLSLFGEIDPEITFEFVPLWQMNEKEKAEIEKIKADTAQVLIDVGAISPQEERQRIADDPESQYTSLDVDDMPNLLAEEEDGLAPKGGHFVQNVGQDLPDDERDNTHPQQDRRAA